MITVRVSLRLEPAMFLPALGSFQALPGNWSEMGISAQCDRHSRGSEERQTWRRERRVLGAGPAQQGKNLSHKKRQETDLKKDLNFGDPAGLTWEKVTWGSSHTVTLLIWTGIQKATLTGRLLWPRLLNYVRKEGVRAQALWSG